MKRITFTLVCLILVLFSLNEVKALRYEFADKKLLYAYEFLPSSDLKTISSSLILAYPVNERSAIEISYLSLENPFLAGSSYIVSYHIAFGVERWKIFWPTFVGGYRFIYTPETDFTTPIDIGIILEAPLFLDLSFRLPIIATLFSKSSMFDITFSVERKGFGFGDLNLGLRSLKPVRGSSFIERTLFFLGVKNRF